MVHTPMLHTVVSDDEIQSQNALWIAKIFFGVFTLAFFIHLYLLIFYTPAWQIFVLVGGSLALIAITGVSYRLIRHDRRNLGIGLIIGTMMVGSVAVSGLVADIGLVMGLLLIAVTLAVAAQTLPRQGVNWVIVSSIVVGISVALLGWGGAPFQLKVPVIETYLSMIAVAAIVVYGGFFFWQFKYYSLVAKLLIAFLIFTLLPLGLISALNNRISGDALTEEVGQKLYNLASSQALAVGDILAQQLGFLRNLAVSQGLESELKTINASYDGDGTSIQARLQRLDQQWSTASDSDPLVQDVLHNFIAEEFRRFRGNFPSHVEVFVTDQYGALVAATNRISDYYQADEIWWQQAFNDGQGAVYIGQPEFDESSHTLAINIAAPVYDGETGAILGVLRTTYTLSALTELINSLEAETVGSIEILFANGQVLSKKQGLAPALDGITPQFTISTTKQPYREVTIAGVPNLASRVPIRTRANEPSIASLGWSLTILENKGVVLASVARQTRLALLLAVVMAGVVAAVAVGVSQRLAGPITRLTTTALQISAGDLAEPVQIESTDEIGKLATAFNLMTGRLRETIDTLEHQVLERTRRLETVVEISHRLTSILDLSDLLRQIVDITKETFNYYHVHIYLVDDMHKTLIMAEGYGEAGAEMKRRGHAISVVTPRSLVARAAREGRVITVENVRDNPDWLPNPLLPDTHAEMAVPILLGTEVVGVLDVQSERVGGLTTEDEAALQALANQIAVAVRNARAFSQTQEALYEAQRMQRLYTGQAWEKFSATHRTTNYEVRNSTLPPLEQIATPEVMVALQQGQTVALRLSGADKGLATSLADKNGRQAAESKVDEAQIENVLATPLKLANQIIGVLGIRTESPERRWTEDEIALVEAISQQMSLAIENARLFEETQRNAWRDRVVSESTAQIWSSDEIEEVMRAAVAQLGDKLRASEVIIRLGTKTELAQG